MIRQEEIKKTAYNYINFLFKREFNYMPTEEIARSFNAGKCNALHKYGIDIFMAGAKYADKHPAKKQTITIDAWVARDINKVVALHRVKPKYKEGFYLGNLMGVLDKNDFSEVTFENSPKKVKVTIELEDE